MHPGGSDSKRSFRYPHQTTLYTRFSALEWTIYALLSVYGGHGVAEHRSVWSDPILSWDEHAFSTNRVWSLRVIRRERVPSQLVLTQTVSISFVHLIKQKPIALDLACSEYSGGRLLGHNRNDRMLSALLSYRYLGKSDCLLAISSPITRSTILIWKRLYLLWSFRRFNFKQWPWLVLSARACRGGGQSCVSADLTVFRLHRVVNISARFVLQNRFAPDFRPRYELLRSESWAKSCSAFGDCWHVSSAGSR